MANNEERIRCYGLIGGTKQAGDLVVSPKDGGKFIVTGIANEEDFLRYHPEWADPALEGLRFEN